MRKHFLVAAALAALASPAAAQQAPVEIGVDAMASYFLSGNHAKSLSIPVDRIRVGFSVTPNLSLEPSASLDIVAGDGFRLTDYSLGIGALYHFSTDRTRLQPYVRPFIEYFHSSATNSSGATVSSSGSTLYGAGLGVKLPVNDRFAWRLEGAIDGNSSMKGRLKLLAGFSIFTH